MDQLNQNNIPETKKHLSLKTLAVILVIVSAVAISSGKTGFFRGDIGGILNQKTPLTQDLCVSNGGIWTVADDEAKIPAKCEYTDQVVVYLEDILKIQLKATCDAFAAADEFSGAGVKFENDGCAFNGKTYTDNAALKKAAAEYSAFKQTCSNAGGIFALNQCSISISSQPIATLKDLNSKIFENDCKAASGIYTANDSIGTCDIQGVGIVSNSTELKTKKLQALCMEAKTLSDSWQNGKATWNDPALCSFIGKNYLNYNDLDTALNSVKVAQETCANGSGVFMDNRCDLDNVKLLKNLCEKKWDTQINAWNFGARWTANNSTCSIPWVFNPAKIFQTSESLALNEALKKGKTALEEFQNMCKSAGGSLNAYTCIYNNKNFYIYSSPPLSLKDEIDAVSKASADAKAKVENAAKMEELQNQLNAKDTERAAAEKTLQEKTAREKEIEDLKSQIRAAQNNNEQAKQIQELKDRLSAAQEQNQQAPTVAPLSVDNVEALTRQISDLKDKINQMQSQQLKTSVPPVVAPIVCRDPALVYDPALKGCVAPTIAPTIIPTPVKSPGSTKIGTTKAGTSTSPTKQLRKSAPKKMQLSKDQIEQLLKALLEQLQAQDQ